MSDFPWLQDVNRAAQHLTRLSLEASAQAALITRGGGLWAYAGQLPQPAALELAAVVVQAWTHSRSGERSGETGGANSDLARFARLKSTGGEYMVYATGLGGNMVLALAFDAETPFSKIRTQAGQLARALSTPPEPEEPPAPAQETPQAFPSATQPVSRVEVQVRPDWSDDSTVSVSAVLPSEDLAEPETAGAPEAAAESLDFQTFNLYDLQPTAAGMYSLHYACVLIPRLPTHHLTGRLTARLAEWVRQLSLAFGWRLEHISVRPDYLLWISNVPPNTSPGYLVKVMRRHTSQRIFHELPNLGEENPSGDFWAPGYLVLTASQPPPPALVKNFVAQTRRQQGVSI